MTRSAALVGAALWLAGVDAASANAPPTDALGPARVGRADLGALEAPP